MLCELAAQDAQLIFRTGYVFFTVEHYSPGRGLLLQPIGNTARSPLVSRTAFDRSGPEDDERNYEYRRKEFHLVPQITAGPYITSVVRS